MGLSLVAARFLSRVIGRLLDRLALEFFLLGVFGFVIAMSALGKGLGVSDAVGALLAGVILADSGVREEIEQRFFVIRDVFAALFFFIFALTIDLTKIVEVGWLVALATIVTVIGKTGVGVSAARLGGLTDPSRHQCRSGARRARRVHHHPRPTRCREHRALAHRA